MYYKSYVTSDLLPFSGLRDDWSLGYLDARIEDVRCLQVIRLGERLDQPGEGLGATLLHIGVELAQAVGAILFLHKEIFSRILVTHN